MGSASPRCPTQRVLTPTRNHAIGLTRKRGAETGKAVPKQAKAVPKQADQKEGAPAC